MRFPLMKFDSMNEADVREEIVAPLLRLLGYRSGSSNQVIREQSLRYPCDALGRRKPTDPLVRGVADYICEAQGRVRWVIEAKSPDVDITDDELDQAYTYARHPEVKAVYYCVCNGRELRVYRTDEGPSQPAILSVTYSQFDQALSAIQDRLLPSALIRDFPESTPDIKNPIGPGLRSIVRITNGSITLHEVAGGVPFPRGMNTRIVSGAIERANGKHLVAFLETEAAFQAVQELNERLGLHRIEMTSEDQQLSADPKRPTLFECHRHVVFPAGEEMLDIASWEWVSFPVPFECDATTVASVIIDGGHIAGTWQQTLSFSISQNPFEAHGDLRIHVT